MLSSNYAVTWSEWEPTYAQRHINPPCKTGMVYRLVENAAFLCYVPIERAFESFARNDE